LTQFWDAYPDVPKFAHSTFLEGHEGTGDVLALVDDDFESFLREMDKKNVFNNTAVFIVADHGLHQGFYWLLSERGRLEHMLPAAYVSLPNWYHLEGQKNMHNAQQKLVTAFDFHQTFVELSGSQPKSKHGKSLFSSIPNRNCREAGVPNELCKCFLNYKQTVH